MKNKSNFRKLDSDKYSLLDDNTGEIQKLVNEALYAVSDNKDFILDSKRYYIIDEKRLRHIILNRDISSNTLGALIVLTQNILLKFNICMDSNDKPFNAMRLSKELNIDSNLCNNLKYKSFIIGFIFIIRCFKSVNNSILSVRWFLIYVNKVLL